MKSRLYHVLAFMILLSTLIAACGGTPTPAAVPTEPALDEPDPTAVPEPQVATDAALAAAYQGFLGDMVGYNTIKMDALAEELLDEPPPFLLDVRTDGELEENGHLPGAVHIPLNELAQHLDLLPSFDTPIVTYCAGGWRATIAMTQLSGAGWKDVRALKAKFSDWVDAGYAVEPGPAAEALVLDTAQPDPAFVTAVDETLSTREGWGVISAEDLNLALTDNPDTLLIDVRKQSELDEMGVIEATNFIHIPIEAFGNSADLLPLDKGTTITVYCGSGHRSTMAMTMLWTMGYENVTSLKGGFGGWASAGYPILGGAPELASAYDAFLADMVAYNTIKMDPLAEELLEEPPPFLLDVRTAAELEEQGHITGAVHIPLAELGQHLALLPSFDTPIVTYCGSGWRATIAMTYLSAAGWADVRALKAKFSDWVAAGYAVEPGLAAEPMVLNAAQPATNFVNAFDQVLSTREGWGVLKVEDFNLALTDNPNLFVIDVRRAEEVEEKGTIEASNFVHIPLEEFIANSDMWPADMDTPISVYCGSGHRSTIAMAILWNYGYGDVTSLKGGFGGWEEAGYPVVEFAMQ